MARWLYVNGNAYDYIVKIEDEAAYVLTHTEDFPNIQEGWSGLTDDEQNERIVEFMKEVIDTDNSYDWEEYDADAILRDIENDNVLYDETVIDKEK